MGILKNKVTADKLVGEAVPQEPPKSHFDMAQCNARRGTLKIIIAIRGKMV